MIEALVSESSLLSSISDKQLTVLKSQYANLAQLSGIENTQCIYDITALIDITY